MNRDRRSPAPLMVSQAILGGLIGGLLFYAVLALAVIERVH